MSGFLYAFDALIVAVRFVVFAIAAVAAVVFLVDWLVRTRRISPFHPIARGFRQAVQPLIVPIEERVVRAGGLPSSAPWWALVAVVVTGILVVVLLQFVRDQVAVAAIAGAVGPRGIYVLLIRWIFGILQLALLVRVIASWFRLSEWKPWIRWAVVLTEPILRPLRRVIPPFGMIDVTPLVAWLALTLIQSAIT